ncbi:hypothetical protein [Aquimarina sp. 2201CG5-10]|uniref:hypothetical protein n=1 Tax=Aquimarina callyspongiae TaxID=3098150 RepID=UPI002AB52C81|nr:hypothetical protein [Aquimarina sp. 2201CG5-10]MDY8135573.1 hypothetical protein [Aquimarina sp. 2201CG5-10]
MKKRILKIGRALGKAEQRLIYGGAIAAADCMAECNDGPPVFCFGTSCSATDYVGCFGSFNSKTYFNSCPNGV